MRALRTQSHWLFEEDEIIMSFSHGWPTDTDHYTSAVWEKPRSSYPGYYLPKNWIAV